MPKLVDHARRRDEVAAVAERVIAELGLEAGLRDVALAGGWSTTVVTHYFADKRELLSHTLKRTIERAAVRIEERVARGESPLAAILEENLPLDARRRQQWRTIIAFWGRAVHDRALEDQQRRRHAKFRSALADALAEALEDVETVDVAMDVAIDVELEARRLFALLDGLAVQAIFEPTDWPPRRQIEIVNRHLEGLGLHDVLRPRERSRRRNAS